MKPKRENQMLGNFQHTGAQAASVWWEPTAASGNAELESHEVAEIVKMRILPPITGGGVVEALSKVQLVLDDKVEEYNVVVGTDTYNVNAPKDTMLDGVEVTFGKPMLAVQNGLVGVLAATCPKYTKRATVRCLAGAGGISANYRVQLYGVRYKAEELGTVLANLKGEFGAADYLVDPATGRTSQYINKVPVAISEATWTQLPGGLDQAVPKIFRYDRTAFNALATTANQKYSMRFDGGNVATREEDLQYKYDIENKILFIKGIGVVSSDANLKETWVDIGGDERPKSHFETNASRNELSFGRVSTKPYVEYKAVEFLPDPLLISNEKAEVFILDNGNSVVAGTTAVRVIGVLVELGSK